MKIYERYTSNWTTIYWGLPLFSINSYIAVAVGVFSTVVVGCVTCGVLVILGLAAVVVMLLLRGSKFGEVTDDLHG